MLAPDQSVIPDNDLALTREAVREAGALALRYFRSGATDWTKSDGTPVTEADLAVDTLLKQRLGEARPHYGWLSEETRDDDTRLEREFLWVVDPIDGTSAFVDGSEQWGISVALVRSGRPVLGAVFNPLRDEFYLAAAGGGATLNDRPLQTSSRTNFAASRVIAHRSILAAKRWGKPWPEVELGMTTALALRLCLVASNRYDATVAVGNKSDWDLAAGDLIVHEAGGRVSNLKGDQLRYNRPATRQQGLVASGASLHDRIISHTATYKR